MKNGSKPIGTATIMVAGMKEEVDVYSFKDKKSGLQYRTIFIEDFSDADPSNLPKTAKVKYQGRKYTAQKYGNPNNQIPTYDFVLPSSK